MVAKEFEGLHPIHLSPVEELWGVLVCPLPRVDNHLLRLLSVLGEVIVLA